MMQQKYHQVGKHENLLYFISYIYR